MGIQRLIATACAGAILLLGSAFAGPNDIFYVNKANVSGIQNGRAWSTAFDTLQEGIEAARNAQGGEVWVARGIYDEPRDSPTGSVQLRPGVFVFGGFQGTELLRSQRNVQQFPSVIDGSRARGGSPASPVVDGVDDALLDGFVIQGGRGLAGAALLNVNESPTIANCYFRNNRAEEFGGAVLNLDGASPIFIGCTFTENRAGTSGGAVGNSGAAAIFRQCTFTGNRAEAAGGAMFNTPDSPVIIEDCFFGANTATVGGGAIFNEGAEPIIERSQFIGNNTDGFGGAIFSNLAEDVEIPSDTLVINSIFARNNAGGGGGAFSTLASDLTLINCTIVGNTAPAELGGAFFNNGANTEVLNSILWYNSDEWIVNLEDSFTEIRWSNIGGGDSGPNNIAEEPRFVNRENDDYRLRPVSPSIDAGTLAGAPAVDINGIPRPANNGVDQGAHETTAPAEQPDTMQCHGGEESTKTAGLDPVIALMCVSLVALRLRRGTR